MFGFYTPLLILQAVCVYHAYRNNAETRWYWFIIFFPLVGCLIYLYHHFYSRDNLQSITQGLKEVVNSNYKLEQLEKALRFSDNTTNKINLADAYMTYGRYNDAIDLYKDCMKGFMADDPALRMKLLQGYFLCHDYQEAIKVGRTLDGDKNFKNDEARIAYAWSQFHSGNPAMASSVFEDMNKSFTNYKHRVAYCHFLKQNGANERLKELLSQLLEEFEHMKNTERKVHRTLIQEISEMAGNINNQK